MALSIVQAVTWEGVTSFPMQGTYGRDDFGRFVMAADGFRYDIPDDAIVRRMKIEEVPQESAPPAETPPEPPAPPPLSEDEITARRAMKQGMLEAGRKARDEAMKKMKAAKRPAPTADVPKNPTKPSRKKKG